MKSVHSVPTPGRQASDPINDFCRAAFNKLDPGLQTLELLEMHKLLLKHFIRIFEFRISSNVETGSKECSET